MLRQIRSSPSSSTGSLMQRLDDAAEHRLPRPVLALLEEPVVRIPERTTTVMTYSIISPVVAVGDPALLATQPGNVPKHALARNHQIEVTKYTHRIRHIANMRRQIIDQSRTALVMEILAPGVRLDSV